jgi:hypothetical protein
MNRKQVSHEVSKLLHSIKQMKFYQINTVDWKSKTVLKNFVTYSKEFIENISCEELVTLFTIYYFRIQTIELFSPALCFENLFLAAKICIECLDEDDFEKFVFYWNIYYKIHVDWKKIELKKSILPTLLQYQLYEATNDVKAKPMLDTIKKLDPDYIKISKLIETHFGSLHKDDYLMIQVCDYLVDIMFRDIYNKIQIRDYEDVRYYLKVVKEGIYDHNNIDIDFFIENLKLQISSKIYIESLCSFVVNEVNIKLLYFYCDYLKLLYLDNTAVKQDVFLIFFLAVAIQILTKKIE